jgi:hypothetical protein
VALKKSPRNTVKWRTGGVHVEDKEPRKGFLGEWDRLSTNLKIIAVILMIVPIYFYPPSVILFLGYAVFSNIRDR